jgi:AsmA protein
MGKSARFVLIALGALVLLVVVAALALPLFLNANNFRARIETTLSKSLGRKVTVGNLKLSIWAGGLVAENVIIEDDPKFSTQPFLQADTVKIRVEVLPLVLHKQVHVTGFALDTPKVDLLRAANGTWNYSSIGGGVSKPATQDAETKQTFPDLTVGHITIEHGQIRVGTVGGTQGAASMPNRVYQQVDLDVKNFAFTKSFPFTLTAQLPANGTVSLKGTAGPLNQADASATPFSAHLEMKHVDPLAAGFVDTSAGISGQVDSLILDAAWSGQQMHVTKLLVDSPRLTYVESNRPKPPKPAKKPGETSMLENLSVDDAQIKDGTLTLTTAGKASAPAVYRNLNAQITNMTPRSSSPFSASAQLPGGGSLSANGHAGPFNQESDAATPLNAQVSLKRFQLGTAGVLPPDAGIAGMADLQAQVQSNGQMLNAAGTARVDGIKLAKNGQPSAQPVQAQFAIVQDERAKTGQIQHATITIGRAAIDVSGTYQTSGPTTALNLKVNGNSVSIDEIESFLPALGVHLPQGSRLKGGTVTTALTVSGSTASPVISGPVRLDNTQLAGFDLGSKLSSLSRLTGGSIGAATGPGTNIRSLSMDVRELGGGIRTDKIALDVTGVGTATGAGSVSEAGALNYDMLLKLTGLTSAPAGNAAAAPSGGGGIGGLVGGLAGLIPGGASKDLGAIGGVAGGVMKSGIPVMIGGTTSNPTFAPDVRGLATAIGTSAARNALNGQGLGMPAAGAKQQPGNQLKNALGGFLGKH